MNKRKIPLVIALGFVCVSLNSFFSLDTSKILTEMNKKVEIDVPLRFDRPLSSLSTAPPPFISNNIPKLEKIENTKDPIYVGACCGIGHRLSRNIPMYNFAYQDSRIVYVMWTDVRWSALFNDTEYIKDGIALSDPGTRNNLTKGIIPDWYPNGLNPEEWYFGHNINKDEKTKTITPQPTFKGDEHKSNLFHYKYDMILAMDKPELWAYLIMLRDSVSPLVLSFLDSIRRQMNENEHLALEESDLAKENTNTDNVEKKNEEDSPLPPPKHHARLCAHVRHGNKETGDWESKEWRHIDVDAELKNTRDAMKEYSKYSKEVSVFIASDSADVNLWFESNGDIPSHWKFVTSEKKIPKPETGVWFGEHKSKTSAILSQEQKDEAMAETIAEIFALGECDALFIPNYSSFSFPSIMLTRARGKSVFFRRTKHFEKEGNVLTGLWAEMSSLVVPFQEGKDNQDTTEGDQNGSDSDNKYDDDMTAEGRRRLLESKLGRIVCDEEL